MKQGSLDDGEFSDTRDVHEYTVQVEHATAYFGGSRLAPLMGRRCTHWRAPSRVSSCRPRSRLGAGRPDQRRLNGFPGTQPIHVPADEQGDGDGAGDGEHAPRRTGHKLARPSPAVRPCYRHPNRGGCSQEPGRRRPPGASAVSRSECSGWCSRRAACRRDGSACECSASL